jgi:hypothetical protein
MRRQARFWLRQSCPAWAILIIASSCMDPKRFVLLDASPDDARASSGEMGTQVDGNSVPVDQGDAGPAIRDTGADVNTSDVPVGSTCPPGSRQCGASCVTGNCCGDGECSGNHACVRNVCAATECRSGYKPCGNDCLPMATCCALDGCCTHSDCGLCQKCLSGRCTNQSASEDLKNECSEGTCRTGICDGSGHCGNTADGQNGPGCTGECRKCRSGACQPRIGDCGTAASCVNNASDAKAADSCENGECVRGAIRSCSPYGCSGAQCRTDCAPGTVLDGGQCIPCGSRGQKCCRSATCGADLACANDLCVPCGGVTESCCTTGKPCRFERSICFLSDYRCHTCGHFDAPCCGEDYTTNDSFVFARSQGTCPGDPGDPPLTCRFRMVEGHVPGWNCEP